MEWISVEDELPDEDIEYLVFSSGKIGVAKYWGNVRRWLNADARFQQGDPVEYWAPMPKPPKGTK